MPRPLHRTVSLRSQLKRLIHEEWRTNVSGTTDTEGRFAFRGYQGAYRLVIEASGKRVEQDFHLTKPSPCELKIVLGTTMDPRHCE